jgi:DNA replication protein DnaC
MALDGKILSRAVDRFEAEKRRRAEETDRLRRAIYAARPRVKEIDGLLIETGGPSALAALGCGADRKRPSPPRKRKISSSRRRAELITEAGYPPGCIDELPKCKSCGDTGFSGRTPCLCLMKIYAEEQRKELSSLLKLGEENFKAFRLDYYDDTVNAASGYSPRKLMEIVYLTCLRYAREFNKNSDNLFLNGGTGLGKTFLSSCIAGEVSRKGFSVVYDTAANIVATFEAARFPRYGARRRRNGNQPIFKLRPADNGRPRNRADKQLFRQRDIRRRKRPPDSEKSTVISSNLGIEEIRKKYSPRLPPARGRI